MKRPILTEIEGYDDVTIRTMMKDIQTCYKNKVEYLSLLNLDIYITLSQRNINGILVEALGDMLDQGVNVDIERYNKMCFQIKEHCLQNSCMTAAYPKLSISH